MADRCATPTCSAAGVPLYNVPWSLAPVCAQCADSDGANLDSDAIADDSGDASPVLAATHPLAMSLAERADLMTNGPDLRAMRQRLGMQERLPVAPRTVSADHRPDGKDH